MRKVGRKRRMTGLIAKDGTWIFFARFEDETTEAA
jgi:hypothetical protein